MYFQFEILNPLTFKNVPIAPSVNLPLDLLTHSKKWKQNKDITTTRSRSSRLFSDQFRSETSAADTHRTDFFTVLIKMQIQELENALDSEDPLGKKNNSHRNFFQIFNSYPNYTLTSDFAEFDSVSFHARREKEKALHGCISLIMLYLIGNY